jgi:hypothetical protein
MFGLQPGHVQPNPIPQRLSSGPDISGPQAGFQRGLPNMSGPRPEHVRVSDTPTARFSPPSFSPALSSSSYTLIFLFEGVAPKMS